MKCNHPECDCKSASIERNGKSYCSEACATGIAQGARTSSGAGCGCGHAGCGASRTEPIPAATTGGDRQGLHARGGEGSGEFRAGAPGESAGLRGDGLVGDAGQRAAERPGRNQPDDARRMGLSEEDQAGSAMKPGAVRPRGVEAPGGADPARTSHVSPSGEPGERSPVRRGSRGPGLEAPGSRDRD